MDNPNLNKLKVLMISHCSHSYFSTNKTDKEELKGIILNDWYFKTASQLKRVYPNIEVECFGVEKDLEKEEEFVENGIRLRFFPTRFSPRYAIDYSPEMLNAIEKEIEEGKKEGKKVILHVHEIHNLHGLMIARRFKNEKIIVQHHGGSWPLRHLKNTRKYQLLYPFFLFGQMWENKVLKNVKQFYVLSKDELEYLKKVSLDSKTEFRTMGIDNVYFEKTDKKTAREKLNFGNEKVLIFLGRINETKGINYLLDAMKELEKERKDIKLKIIGFGEIDKFKEYSKQLGLNNVEFTGPVFGEKKLLYLSAADALILPSLKEGAPVVVMEALARNLPVVVTDVGGVKMMIENGREGIIIRQKSSSDIVNAVNQVLSWKDKDLRQYAEKYKWEEIIKKTVEDYNNLFN